VAIRLRYKRRVFLVYLPAVFVFCNRRRTFMRQRRVRLRSGGSRHKTITFFVVFVRTKSVRRSVNDDDVRIFAKRCSQVGLKVSRTGCVITPAQISLRRYESRKYYRMYFAVNFVPLSDNVDIVVTYGITV